MSAQHLFEKFAVVGNFQMQKFMNYDKMPEGFRFVQQFGVETDASVC